MATDTWTQVGKQTLSVAGDLLNPTLTSLQLLAQVISLQLEGAGNFRAEMRNNNVATNSYAVRFNQNGLGDVSAGNASQGLLGNTASNDEDNFVWFSQMNVLNSEKNYICRTMDAGGATASSPPLRIKVWGKLNNLPLSTSIQIINPLGAGDFNTGSQMQVQSPLESGVGVGQLGSWVEIGRFTVNNATTTIMSITNIPDKRYLWLLWDYDRPGANIDPKLEFNGVTATDYAIRGSLNGAADVTSASLTNLDVSVNNASNTIFGTGFISNLAGKEKMFSGHMIANNANGAGIIPIRRERVGKMDTTTDSTSINRIDLTGSANFSIGSTFVVLGWTPADTTTTESNFWVPLGEDVATGLTDILQTVIPARRYLWVQFFINMSGFVISATRFNSDAGANYSDRFSFNGAADGSNANNTRYNTSSTAGGVRKFYNFYIRNTIGTEKLMICPNGIDQITLGAATAPTRLELYGKWANTTSAITHISVNNDSTGDIDTGSFLRVWGHD